MNRVMFFVEEVAEKIAQGKKLLLAGDERLLSQLPAGDWIGGTIANFITEDGGACTREKIHVIELPDFICGMNITSYDETSIHRVYKDAPQNGFSVIIIPAKSRMHFSFALGAPDYDGFAIRPLIGWISGVHLDDLGKTAPKVYNGKTGKAIEDGAVVMHVSLPADRVADIGIINIFEQGDGETITFPADGFSATDANIDGQNKCFGEYLFQNKLDKRLPLVADYHGVMINTSFKEGDHCAKDVEFYAPVFSGLRYRHAKPVDDYVGKYIAQLPEGLGHQITFSFHCILNYIYSELDGKKIADITGPTTFGEIAYQLLNQTMVYLRIIELPPQR